MKNETTLDDLDGFVETKQVEELTGYTRRWLAQKIKRGQFPPPDAKGAQGRAHRWRRSTIRRALDQMAGVR